jgi:hypothetical protein
VEENVLRLEVTVNYPMLVGVLQCSGQLPGDRQSLLDPELLFPLEFLAERLASNERNHVPEQTTALTGIDEGEDVWMIQLCCEADLGKEPLPAQHCGYVRAKDLESDVAVVSHVMREVDSGHPAAPELAVEAIAIAEGVG